MSTYLSQKALEELEQELKDRKNERSVHSERISAAKELGDLSENFEYHTAKEDQAQNESRIFQLEEMIKNVVIVEQQKGGNTISLGTTFIVECDGTKQTFEMVGSTEANPLEGKISNESPIGAAFSGSRIDEIIEVDTPSGKRTYKIIEIK
ncbi:MAG: Transcription elongation factor GreA [Candidatus Uhrbacteria bacterium GW2011_GWE2_40_58]|nr:MAG: Transcription elongation factor GreA [Candidatus Uhrbacteria bacterium GW2011_GWF2_40_263]KKR67803.1 MAG: Transcription elongation factor GreA [Candidatus Uhrbacteria bacterium GW2011_GWE2_40_58]OGL94511.1 MAG: hypothetical protein A2239_00485 [Candidatus Uhrbacteria bacterium RIFOXYA2_FULL_40_9]OGL96761.1 MAG: hypothetical protein A2332_04460 [Candidatus Uhrbacteria bacterium RIFOXYB2_FULL_41_18]HBK34477.1 transcription elongation factor GreA [Candidatus Uhrbacteria bacterium]